MLIGVPREIKNHEYRVGLTPASVQELCARGHRVLVEAGAGAGAGMDDTAYRAAGADIATTAADVFASAELVVKVKEPQPAECRQLRPGQVLFTYLHLAPDPEQAGLLLESGVTAIAYETVTDARGRLPLLAPMSEVAGRLAVQAGAHCLEKAHGGAGVLLGGVPGVAPGHVVVIGGGVVGENATQMAVGLGAEVTLLDTSLERLRQLADKYGSRVRLVHANAAHVAAYVAAADLVVGAVLVPGAAAPHVVTRAMLAAMRPGSVVVDVAIDQGGCCETSHPTTHAEPTFVVDRVVHYCVANMPGAVPRTSTLALNNATLPYVLALADKGVRRALADDAGLAAGLNIDGGRVTCRAVAEALGYTWSPLDPVRAA
ncbi:MAG: alanine dehydrogenase [Gammaproteobacteria bacterium]|nr:alanine dehydrogenase [Gammaproteobacteria bacterium]